MATRRPAVRPAVGAERATGALPRLAKDVPRGLHSHSLYISLYPQVHVDGTPKVRLAKTTPEASRRPGDYERMPPPRSYGICR